MAVKRGLLILRRLINRPKSRWKDSIIMDLKEIGAVKVLIWVRIGNIEEPLLNLRFS